MGRLDRRVAVVTGAAQGIGATFAHALAAEGAAVVIADIDDGGPVARAIKAAGGRAIAVRTDVADEQSCHDMAETALNTFGTLDILINNAAIFGKLDRVRIEEIDLALWDRIMAVNVRGPFLCTRAAIAPMRRQKYGKIVNICTARVFAGGPFFLHYDASKGAVLAMTRSMARELGDDGISVNAIAPGSTMSENIKARTNWMDGGPAAKIGARALKRLQEPEDLVGAMLFLSSRDSDFMTGQTMVVDGGASMW
ncbi:MAG: glucose 1-dehydrogenase [Alphaproteobacteria bacterium]|nr:glucose 1-dehydrogenase [Alphaproteobacteria bacterium]